MVFSDTDQTFGLLCVLCVQVCSCLFCHVYCACLVCSVVCSVCFVTCCICIVRLSCSACVVRSCSWNLQQYGSHTIPTGATTTGKVVASGGEEATCHWPRRSAFNKACETAVPSHTIASMPCRVIAISCPVVFTSATLLYCPVCTCCLGLRPGQCPPPPPNTQVCHARQSRIGVRIRSRHGIYF